MAVEVSRRANAEPKQHPEGVHFTVSDGHLTVWRRGNEVDAIYAPGTWQVARVV